jgi:methionine synthase II (cobalamin-independent)
MATLRAQREVFFVGSIPLPDAASVFETLGTKFRDNVRRIPDGETGNRLGWLEWQEPYLARHPQLESVPSEGDWRNPTAPEQWKHRRWYRPRQGVDVGSIDLGEIGYARNAIASYKDFISKKKAGEISRSVRMLVAVPSPFNLVNFHFAPEYRTEIEPVYEAALLAELQKIADAIPHSDLALQWDCAHDMQAYDGAREPWFPNAQEGIAERLSRIGDMVPAEIELGYHLCYGSFGGRHFVEPKDMGAMVSLINAVTAGIERPIQWVHMPVPMERSDNAYFAPLTTLRIQPGCRVYLGLIHDGDGVEGTLARIKVAERYLPDFGIATECGFGRRDAASVRKLIDLHARLAAGG